MADRFVRLVRVRRLSGIVLTACAIAALCASTLTAQRRGRAAVPVASAAIDSFVTTMRDMAAWAIVTPAAHIPVGGLLDAAGRVNSVVGTGREATLTPDSVLHAFRQLIGAAGRRQRVVAIGVGFLVRRGSTRSGKPRDAVAVEIESADGFRANYFFPYTKNEFGEPIFGNVLAAPGTLTQLVPAKRRWRR